VVLAAALTSAFVWPGFAESHAAAVLSESSSAAHANASAQQSGGLAEQLAPAERLGEQTELVKAMPDQVAGFVQTNIDGAASWKGGDKAIESWRFTYADGVGAEASTLLVDVGQWEDAALAEEFFATLLATADEPIAEGDVLVGDAPAGRFALVEGIPTADQTEPGVLYWRNGTLVFRVTGPISQLQQFYSELPI